MKKLLIGCGVITLILVTLVVGGVIYVTMKLKATGERFEQMTAQLQELDSRYPFATPDDGSVYPTRLEAYFEVRNNMIDMVSENPTVKKMVSNAQGGKEKIGVGEFIGLATNFIPEVMDRFHSEMDSRSMSAAEYNYNARVVYSAISQGNDRGDQTMMDIYDKLVVAVDSTNLLMDQANQPQHKIDLSRTLEDIEVESADDVIEENIRVVKKHEHDILKDPSFAFVEFFFLRAAQGGPVAINEGETVYEIPAEEPVAVE